MALPRRWAHRETSITPGQVHIPKQSPISTFSTTQGAWYGKVPSYGLQQQPNHGHPSQFLNSTGKLEASNSRYAMAGGFKFAECKFDDRESIRPQNQQRRGGPDDAEAHFDCLPAPIITADTSTARASLAGSGPGSQAPQSFIATTPPNSQRNNNSTIPAVAQSLPRSNLGRALTGSLYPSMGTAEVQNYVPRLQTQKNAFKSCGSNWDGPKEARSTYVNGTSHQQGYPQPGWAESTNRMACMPISSTSDTNIESAFPTIAEWPEQTGSRENVPDFTKDAANSWHGVQNSIQQPQRWPDDVNNDISPSLITQINLPITQDGWNELPTTSLGYQCSPESSFSTCFTPDTLHEPVSFDSPDFHDMNVAMGYIDQNPSCEKLSEWQGQLAGIGPFEPNTTTIKQPGRPRKIKTCETLRGAIIGTQRTSEKDEYLIQCKRAGMSYKEIKEKGNFSEAESTLRGRFRTLTKRKEQRVRKPRWQEKDDKTCQPSLDKLAIPFPQTPAQYDQYLFTKGLDRYQNRPSSCLWCVVCCNLA
ncbi:conserved hypothetical protein [Histoplasma capsulatum G186AR]|uniref:Myb-like domain-containing protein n=1 Tax=Ajellomyces capsulatus (strain G186AR / H82 / ATCC MYA-2454 / RMSCC 2432) TaxID=447093 RepID=C0NG35_AJECG|nr:uncharacterized protein HCBG_01851 [Histoplasma capsulatum G186AR]EEH10206.1 conserved hypothetical protein [Histoplasma capsulatum G186AR]